MKKTAGGDLRLENPGEAASEMPRIRKIAGFSDVKRRKALCAKAFKSRGSIFRFKRLFLVRSIFDTLEFFGFTGTRTIRIIYISLEIKFIK